MSYVFDKIVGLQTAFHSTEELFISFLASIIQSIIEPFKCSSHKFNISKHDLSQLNLIFVSINELHEYHQECHYKFSADLDITTPTSNYNRSSGTITIQSPPPNSVHHRIHNHNHNGNRHRHSRGGSAQIQNLSSIFKHYAQFPSIYRKYFESSLSSLLFLSNIISSHTNMKKWFRRQCDDILLLYPFPQHIEENKEDKRTTYINLAEFSISIHLSSETV